MPPAIAEFMEYLLALPPLREGDDFFGGESASMRCLELLLNQRVGVERATAAALAVHYHFGKPFSRFDLPLSDVTRWPYPGQPLRTPARSLHRLIADHLAALPNPHRALVGTLPDHVVGALASLERYYHRPNGFFDPIRQVELEPEALSRLAPERFREITGLNFPRDHLPRQLASTAAILTMRRDPEPPSLASLTALERVGQETAATLQVYLFDQPALIIDDYLRRIFHRHFFVDSPRVSRRVIEGVVDSFVETHDDAHRLHARINEIGTLHCFATQPDCEQCPLRGFERRRE